MAEYTEIATRDEIVEHLTEIENKLTRLEIASVGLWLEYRMRLLPMDAPESDVNTLAFQADRRLHAIESTHQQRKQAIDERFQP